MNSCKISKILNTFYACIFQLRKEIQQLQEILTAKQRYFNDAMEMKAAAAACNSHMFMPTLHRHSTTVVPVLVPSESSVKRNSLK